MITINENEYKNLVRLVNEGKIDVRDISLRRLPVETIDDEEILRLFITKGEPAAFTYASEELRDNEAIVRLLLSYPCGSGRFGSVSKRLRDDKELALLACSLWCPNANYLSERLRDDDDIVEAVLSTKQVGYIKKETFSQRIMSNKELVLKLLEKGIIKFIPDALAKDPDVVKAYLAKKHLLEDQPNYFADDLEMMLFAVHSNRKNVKYVSKRLKNDRLFAFRVLNGTIPNGYKYDVDHGHYAYITHDDFSFMGNEIKADPIFIEELVKAFLLTSLGNKYTKESLLEMKGNIVDNIEELALRHYFMVADEYSPGPEPEELLDFTAAIEREEARIVNGDCSN